MSDKTKEALIFVEQANRCAERAFWWVKGVNADEATRLKVVEKVNEVLKLLQKVDNLTLDITISIKQQIEE